MLLSLLLRGRRKKEADSGVSGGKRKRGKKNGLERGLGLERRWEVGLGKEKWPTVGKGSAFIEIIN